MPKRITVCSIRACGSTTTLERFVTPRMTVRCRAQRGMQGVARAARWGGGIAALDHTNDGACARTVGRRAARAFVARLFVRHVFHARCATPGIVWRF